MTDSNQAMKLVLKSKDGEKFEIEKQVAMQINFVKGMLEGTLSKILSKVSTHQRCFPAITIPWIIS